MYSKQTMNNQKGEIKFRKLLSQQQVDGEEIFKDEYDFDGIQKILLDRMKETFNQFMSLKEGGINLSPYLEIGSERGQRALVMENDIGVHGAAIDISFDMLKSCEFYSNVFNKENIPLRICCDIYDLPFKTASVPFIFCYATLHHFPSIFPVIDEINRVLSHNGYFFFGDEPYKKSLHFNLYKQRNKIYSREYFSRNKITKIFDTIFSTDICNEEDYNIIENNYISIDTWKKALQCFDQKMVTLFSLGGVDEDLYHPRSILKYWLAFLSGGLISGLCHKPSKESNTEIASIYDCLICPSCKLNSRESQLFYSDNFLQCSYCKKVYLPQDGIFILLSDDKVEKLYPSLLFEQRDD